jgi:hypothetical protein
MLLVLLCGLLALSTFAEELSLSPAAEWDRLSRECTPLNALGSRRRREQFLPRGRPEASYAHICNDMAQRQWVYGDPIVLVTYTDAFLDALFYRKADGATVECAVPFEATCTPDDAMVENFGALLCASEDLVPCVTSPMPSFRDLSAIAVAQRDSCRQWGLGFDCVVHRKPFGVFGDLLLRADGVVFDGANSHIHHAHPNVFPQQKCGHQSWIFNDWRSVVNYPLFGAPEFMSRFDITAGYRRNFTVWGADMIGNTQTAVHARPEFAKRRSDVLLAFFISNCDAKNNRLAFIRDLVKHLPPGSYHSFGHCLHNADVPAELRDRNKYREKTRVFEQYKFALAIENANDVDYVTEKVWDALSAGAIPVYGGAPNVNDFVPEAAAIVNMDDFASAEQLAAHLVRVASDEALYNAYHAWRFNETILAALREVDRNHRGYFECQVCKVIAESRRQ